MARAYAGTVMLEGATLSEGGAPPARSSCSARPTSTPRGDRRDAPLAPQWLEGCALREMLVRADLPQACRQALQRRPHPRRRPFYDHQAFKPWRLQALAFKAIRRLYPDYPLWRDFPYEYEFGKLAIDVINGGPAAARVGRRSGREPGDLDALTVPDEQAWHPGGIATGVQASERQSISSAWPALPRAEISWSMIPQAAADERRSRPVGPALANSCGAIARPDRSSRAAPSRPRSRARPTRTGPEPGRNVAGHRQVAALQRPVLPEHHGHAANIVAPLADPGNRLVDAEAIGRSGEVGGDHRDVRAPR
jgi:hypothetical protein